MYHYYQIEYFFPYFDFYFFEQIHQIRLYRKIYFYIQETSILNIFQFSEFA